MQLVLKVQRVDLEIKVHKVQPVIKVLQVLQVELVFKDRPEQKEKADS